jgi:hypothetical protein
MRAGDIYDQLTGQLPPPESLRGVTARNLEIRQQAARAVQAR